MSIIANDLPRYQGDIDDYSTSYNRLIEETQMLAAHMTDLNQMWEGEAHAALIATFAADYAKLQELNAELYRYRQDMQYAHGEYSSCENQIAAMIDSIRV